MGSAKLPLSDSQSRLEGRWTYHPAHGIIHQSPCAVCIRYTAHVPLPGRSSKLDPSTQSLQAALEKQERRRDLEFSNGVREGRRLQQLEDDILLEEMRDDLTQARLTFARVRQELLGKLEVAAGRYNRICRQLSLFLPDDIPQDLAHGQRPLDVFEDQMPNPDSARMSDSDYLSTPSSLLLSASPKAVPLGDLELYDVAPVHSRPASPVPVPLSTPPLPFRPLPTIDELEDISSDEVKVFTSDPWQSPAQQQTSTLPLIISSPISPSITSASSNLFDETYPSPPGSRKVLPELVSPAPLSSESSLGSSTSYSPILQSYSRVLQSRPPIVDQWPRLEFSSEASSSPLHSPAISAAPLPLPSPPESSVTNSPATTQSSLLGDGTSESSLKAESSPRDLASPRDVTSPLDMEAKEAMMLSFLENALVASRSLTGSPSQECAELSALDTVDAEVASSAEPFEPSPSTPPSSDVPDAVLDASGQCIPSEESTDDVFIGDFFSQEGPVDGSVPSTSSQDSETKRSMVLLQDTTFPMISDQSVAVVSYHDETDSGAGLANFGSNGHITDLPALSSSTQISAPNDIWELQTLMRKAHELGDNEALVQVRLVCATAHLTPRRQRTEMQLFALLYWRNPPQPLPSFHPLPPRIFPCQQSASDLIYVDASTSWGIGFVSNGTWLAWKLKEGWKTGGRDITWAEMIAIELGLLAVIAAGRHTLQLHFHSDNKGVIQSLNSGGSSNGLLRAVVQVINDLVKKHQIRMTLKWIPTKENPADGPSRGILPSITAVYPFVPAVPARLSQFIEPMSTL